jgi:hypothetical protein
MRTEVVCAVSPKMPLALAVGLPLHVIEAEDPVGGAWLPGAGLIQGRTGGCLRRGLLQGLGDVARHIPGHLHGRLLG